MSLTPASQARLDQMRAEIDDLVRLVAAHKAVGCVLEPCPGPEALDRVAARDCGHRFDLVMQTLILLWEERAAHAKTRDNFETYVESHTEAAGQPHLIELREDGWTIQHPLSCRPNLFACPTNRAALHLPEPPSQLGVFEVELNDAGDRLVVGDRVGGEPS